jgi:hypothetical protein
VLQRLLPDHMVGIVFDRDAEGRPQAVPVSGLFSAFFLLTGARRRPRMFRGGRRAETTLLRRPAAADVACASLPGAVVLGALLAN